MAIAQRLSFWLLLASFSLNAQSARIAKRRQVEKNHQETTTKFIAGIPVFNYNLAYGKRSSNEFAVGENSELQEDWLVMAKTGTTDDQLRALCKIAECVRLGNPSEGGVPFFEVRGTEEELEAVLQSAAGVVEFVEPDLEVYMIPEIEAEDQIMTASWGLERVGAPLRANDGSGVHVYVLDTGVRTTHQDLRGRAIPTLDMSSGSAVVCDGAVTCAVDKQGHGTHCAGTAAGTTYGVAPGAAVHSVKVLGDSGGGAWSWSYEALDWLATKGQRPAVASMSLGGRGTQLGMRNAVDAAVTAGVTVVVAGGNSNDDACRYSPAFIPSAITVGSTTSSDVRSSFSNYGSCTDIWAPGSDIVSAGHTSDTAKRSLSGTSMACPHVSGAAALVLQNKPGAKSPKVLQDLLANAATDFIRGLKSGDVNKLLYVGAGGPPPAPPAPPAKCPIYCSLCILKQCKTGCSFCKK